MQWISVVESGLVGSSPDQVTVKPEKESFRTMIGPERDLRETGSARYQSNPPELSFRLVESQDQEGMLSCSKLMNGKEADEDISSEVKKS